MTAFRLSLPWPPRPLHPNSRAHWGVRARSAKIARRDACITAQAAGARVLGWGGAHVTVTFHPPNRHKRDLDGALSACKPAFDGIADATGIDDSLWTFGAPVMGEPVKGGCVIVEITRP